MKSVDTIAFREERNMALESKVTKRKTEERLIDTEENFQTTDTQEWVVDTQESSTEDTEDFVLIEDDSDVDVKSFIITEKKRLRSFRNCNNEFKLELIKTDNGEALETGLLLDIIGLRKLVRLLPKLHGHYLDCLKGKRVIARYHLCADIYVSVNYQYACVDVRKFYTPKDNESGKLLPTKRGISYNLVEFGVLQQLLNEVEAMTRA